MRVHTVVRAHTLMHYTFKLGFDYLRSLRTVEQQTNNSHEGALVQYDNVIGVIDVRWSCAMWSTE